MTEQVRGRLVHHCTETFNEGSSKTVAVIVDDNSLRSALAQNILENMKEAGLTLEGLTQVLSTEKRKVAEPSMSAECAILEPAEKKSRVTKAMDLRLSRKSHSRPHSMKQLAQPWQL